MKKSQLRQIIREEIENKNKIKRNLRESFSQGQINFPIDNLEDLNKFFIKDYTRVVGEAPDVDLKGILRGDADEMYEMDYAQEIVDLMHAGELTDEKTSSELLYNLSGEYFD